LRAALLALALAATLSGCRTPGEPVIVSATPPPASTMTPPAVALLPADTVGPFEFPPGTNPLTGLLVDDAGVLQRRPLAVKISNAPDGVRPQAGIGAADLVFEHYVEGDLTRFTAIFWTSTPPRVGSIRSARLIDLELPDMYGALFVYSGASEPIRERIAASAFAPRAYEGVTTGEPLYFRDPAIDAPHNLFAVPAAVWERATVDGINGPPGTPGGLAFAAAPPPDGQPAAHVTVDYGPDVVRWTYDADTGRYRREVDGEPHRDANSGDQVTAANVVVIYAHHQDDESIIESEWQGVRYYSTEIALWLSGPAVVIRDGFAFGGMWARPDTHDALSLWVDDAHTQPLILKPGNTWFEVVPLDFAGVAIE